MNNYDSDIYDMDAKAVEQLRHGSNPAIEVVANSQAERPTQTFVTDAVGKMLVVGDRVIVRATVESINHDGLGCNVVLRTVEEMPAAGGHAPHKSAMHLNGKQCVLIERSTR